MSTTLEMARQAYEDIETYERAIAAELDKKPRTTKQQVWQQHHISNLVERIQVWIMKSAALPLVVSLHLSPCRSAAASSFELFVVCRRRVV